LFTRACLWAVFWARWIQSSISHLISLRSMLLLPSYLCIGLPSDVFFPGFPTKNLVCVSFQHRACQIPHLSHPWFGNRNIIW
jgi:hypothetical protein